MEEDEWDDALLSEIAALETRHLQSHSRQGAPAAASAAAWSCRSCTLQNEAARAACQVCGTPRGQTYQARTSPSRVSTSLASSTAARKTVQARLSFDGTAAPVAVPPSQQRQQQQAQIQDEVGRSEPSPFAAREQPVRSSQQTTLTSAATGSGLVLTSRRSGGATGTAAAAAMRMASVSPVQMPRHAAGEDAQAKTRYVDVVARSNLPQIDYEAAQHFVYPTNYSVRDYQLTIAEKALYHNTLVSLPTGLGKTLVAAVVMYNFYRWFPTGKIVFMAPTKPLVAQQIKACHEIMGIPLSDTAELQGNVPPTMRRVLWNSRRVFFCTPQSLQNDLRRGVCAAEKFVCIVVDEAHRATGNYAYCCVVQEIEAKTPFFRILALSATPGAKFDVIQDVVTNLRISHIESRSADDPDVKKYTHARQEEVIVCRLGAQIVEVKTLFLKCFTPIIQRLLRGNIIPFGDPERLSSWHVLQAREKFRKSPNYASNRSAESDLALLVSLLHAKSLLTGHGLSSFRDQILNWAEERKKGKMSWSKREMLQSAEFQSLEMSLGVTEGASSSSTNTASHPKLVKLREVLLEHFQRHAAAESSTRAIVFTQYRASVSEIVALLRPLAPLLSVQPFIGQGSSGKAKENKGQTQKVQQEIVRRFRLGEFNVLVATCIAEEGLDIGEVDLIVSFDALTSPVRMIQRMGRTGRKRVGRVIILVTEGDEQKKLARSASAAKSVSRALTTYKSKFTYSKCPRMLPATICPALKELAMNIPTFHASQVGGKMASAQVDPDLWQLSDAERAVALMKYFPPNFAISSRKRLFPVVANRMHLLRRQPRYLGRKGVSSRVGYSARSIILRSIVRKINGVEEIMESDSDDDDKGDNAGSKTVTADSSNTARFNSTQEPTKRLRRSSVATNDADTDSDLGSPWRQSNMLDNADGEGKHDESFGAMDESVNSIDMHFSPQFIDSATQFIPVVEESGQSKENTKRQQDGEALTPTAKKQKVDPSKEDLAQAPWSSNGVAFTSRVVADTGRAQPANDVPNVLGGQDVPEHPEAEETQQMSATLSLTLTSDSPRPASRAAENASHELSGDVCDSTEATQQLSVAPRPRSTRQLQFDENDVHEHETNQTQSTEHLQREPPASKTEQTSEKNSTTPVEDGDTPAFSFALLPPQISSTGVGNESKSGSEDDDQDEEEPSAFSFALLPPLCTTNGTTQSKPSQELAIAVPQEVELQPVEDATDGDEVDETNETKPAIKEDVAESFNQDLIVVDLTEEEDCCAIVKEKVKSENVPESTTAEEAGVTSQRATQKNTQPEQEEEECCSVCLANESYDDDPIVFCDGCNVAVHQFCYGIRVVPSDKWFCDMCTEGRAGGKNASKSQSRCDLCPHHGGAFKRTECGKWVHVQCFLWIPEFRVDQGEDDMLVFGALSNLDPDRATLDCSLCHSKKGKGIIQCAHKRCLTAFHVSCAAYAHYRMDQLDPPDEEDVGSGTLFLAYCPLHRKSTAPLNISEYHKTPPAAKARSPKPPLPTSATRMTSPSNLLASPSSAEVKNKYKTFRRLKRKYDASQSQMFTQPGSKVSPASTSPWQKRIRRSKRRRQTSRALAAAYIDDTADVRGGANDDDDDEDDYGDDYRDAADDSFINDSSQLLYSQSVESPEETGDNSARKKKRKKYSPNMRAIYARSLFESQNSPLLLRRGGRQLGALPTNGIIRACLDELHNGPSEAETTPSPQHRSRSRVPATPENTAAAAPLSASATVTESDGDNSATEAEPSPSLNLLGAAPLQSIKENSEDEDEKKDGGLMETDMTAPSFSLLGTLPSAPSAISTRLNSGSSVHTAAFPQPVGRSRGTNKDEVQKKIEANRLKALKKLEERRKAKLQVQTRAPQQQAPPAKNVQPTSISHSGSGHGFTSAAALMSTETHDSETAPSFSLLSSTTNAGQLPPPRDMHLAATPTVDLTWQKPTKPEPSQPEWIIFTSSSFARSSGFPTFLSEKHGDCTVAIDDSLEADTLLSVRTAVVFLTAQQLHELAVSAPAQNVVKSRRVGTLLAMYKKIVVAMVHDGSDSPEMMRLRQLPSVSIVAQPHIESLCAQLHRLAHQELVEGYELPSPSLCRSDFSGGVVRSLDKDFASRLQFFRTIPALSLGSALSLSFRFKNFVTGQVPVLKFNEMHWRRMLPWISELTAEEVRNHVQQNAERR